MIIITQETWFLSPKFYSIVLYCPQLGYTKLGFQFGYPFFVQKHDLKNSTKY